MEWWAVCTAPDRSTHSCVGPNGAGIIAAPTQNQKERPEPSATAESFPSQSHSIRGVKGRNMLQGQALGREQNTLYKEIKSVSVQPVMPHITTLVWGLFLEWKAKLFSFIRTGILHAQLLSNTCQRCQNVFQHLDSHLTIIPGGLVISWKSDIGQMQKKRKRKKIDICMEAMTLISWSSTPATPPLCTVRHQASPIKESGLFTIVPECVDFFFLVNLLILYYICNSKFCWH